jgi:hydroxymethylbilane synthase
MSHALRIGSRGSPLAVAQAEWVAAELKRKNPRLTIEFKRITTTGDRDANSALTAIGGKGVFVKEIEDALLAGEIDLAIHSLKDMPQSIPGGLRLGPCPKREVAADVLISRFGEQLHELPRGSTIGTSFPRCHAAEPNDSCAF